MSELWLDPTLAGGAGRDLASAGEHLSELRSGPGAELAAMSGAHPWGNDDMGRAFERNYRPAEDQFLQAWAALGSHVAGLGDAVIQAVREVTETDLHASVRVEHTYRNRR
ncbi:hypothetical protein [Winogradskya humida]|uniref:Uncharacterized protein n=1 Tax=Winogradskya humida TaxID=113566 RepID=A0ABQ3ZNH1_9ACTN|nr:hypothetical protein [Actinoplanes humidus]GIE20131.1 hypothetical protein Ahu01nite_032330 [Actinoplanes humidus]